MNVDEALFYAELSAATVLERTLAAEVRRLRAIEARARKLRSRLPIEETTSFERGQLSATVHILGGTEEV